MLPSDNAQVELSLRPGKSRTRWRVASDAPVDAAVGCEGTPGYDSGLGFVTVWWCPLAPPPRQLRYRVSFTGANPFNEAPELDDYVIISVGSVGGVVYAGAGPDTVIGGDRVYGGRGSDSINGVRVYGGPGSDGLSGDAPASASGRVVLRGGPGGDDLRGPGRLYGGPGDDTLYAVTGYPGREMLVGGPGHDRVELYDQGWRENAVVRLRGGGTDRVSCARQGGVPENPRFDAFLFVDRSDRVDSDCPPGVRVLLTERSRYPYP